MGMEQIQTQDDGFALNSSILLEFAASDDVESFRAAVENSGVDINRPGRWYGRRMGSRKMAYEERTPLMIAALYGSTDVLRYILDSGKVHVNIAAGSDRATALHCAAAGGSFYSLSAVESLVAAAADVNSLDGSGRKPSDSIPNVPSLNFKKLEKLLKGEVAEDYEQKMEYPLAQSPRKEFPAVETAALPDINTGVYGTDEFRMYSFKIKPCSRAYTHDWTECPFAHPGENARRRDTRKVQYSCVPCPEFKKGSCKKGEDCEYAHGVFESWLHPAQYRTRLCKDEVGCTRKVCFFAHKTEELRPVYASTGSALPDVTAAMGSPKVSAPLSPSKSGGGGVWQSKVGFTAPPSLQLPGSRLRSSLNARDVDFERELAKLETQLNHQQKQQQKLQLIDEIYGVSSPSRWQNGLGNFADFGSINCSSPVVPFSESQLQQLESPIGLPPRRNLRSSYPPPGISSPPPSRKLSPPRAGDTPKSMAAAVLSSRAPTFARRSQSFNDRGTAVAPVAVPTTLSPSMSANLSNWGAPDGRLDWGIKGEELSKLRRANSFGLRGSAAPQAAAPAVEEPDFSWVNSLVKDVHGAPWMEKLYIEQEQMV